MIDIFVPGDPKGQPRPRAFARRGHVRVYDPGTAEAWKSQIALAVGPQQPLDGPVWVELAFAMRRPKSHYTTRGAQRDNAPQWHAQKPDADNLAKAAMDALTTIGAWRDDAQVVALLVTKQWSNTDVAGCHITVKQPS